MKAKLHPNYAEALYHCASCGNEWVSGTTKLGGTKKEYKGKQFPVVPLEICSACHPFYTGKSNLIDTTGRVEKFNRRFGKAIAAAKKA